MKTQTVIYEEWLEGISKSSSPTEAVRMAEPMLSFRPTMLDPSVYMSDYHLRTLLHSGETFYSPATFSYLLYEKPSRLTKVLADFNWFSSKPTLSSYYEQVRDITEPYKMNLRYVEELYEKFKDLHVEPDTQQILLEELSFLRERSSILFRLKRTAHHFKTSGIAILDATNSFRDIKSPGLPKDKGAPMDRGCDIGV